MKYIFDFYRNIVLTTIDAKVLRYEIVKESDAVDDDDSDDHDHDNAHGDHDEDGHCEVLIVLREALFSVASCL